MDRRLQLDAELREVQEEILGYQHTYFEPPESVRMQYDAIVYNRTGLNVHRADNKSYGVRDSYQVMVISRDPETKVPEAIQWRFARCAPGRAFVRDNLYHYTFTIIY